MHRRWCRNRGKEMLDTITTEADYESAGFKFEGSLVRPHKTDKTARYCECGTKLSMYNLSGTCYLHTKGIVVLGKYY